MLKSWWGSDIKMVICEVVCNCVSLSYRKLNSSIASPSCLVFRLFLLFMEIVNCVKEKEIAKHYLLSCLSSLMD